MKPAMKPAKKSAPAARPAADAIERPLVSVDVIVFTVHEGMLKLLLVRRPDTPDDPAPGRWALPGGFVDVARDRSLVDCARRKLADKTGVTTPYLEQLGSWGSATRDPRGWSTTHAYFALVAPPASLAPPDAQDLPATPGSGSGNAAWLPADEAARKRLAFDHGEILATALARLRGKVEYTSLPAFVLPEPFTLPELQQAYEVVLGRPLDKSAFRRRMLDAGFLAEDGPVDGAFGRAAMGYRIKDRERATLFPRNFRSGE